MTFTEPLCLLIADAGGGVAFRLGFPVLDASGNGHRPTWHDVLSTVVCADELPDTFPDHATALSVKGVDDLDLTLRLLPLGGGRAHLVLVEQAEGVPTSNDQRLHALGMVAAGVAHEMNNLLTLGMGWLQLGMIEHPEEADENHPLAKVLSAMEQLGALTGNLLDFARAPSGIIERLDVNAVIRRTTDLIDYQLVKADIALEIDLADDVGTVRGSDGELAQALLNLLLNARDAMPDGGSLRVVSRRDDAGVVIQVIDTGCGIAPDVCDRIFAPFFTTRQGSGGTGLGLPVCRQIIERHGGTLSVDSAPGEGTTFTIRVPVGAGSVALAE